MVIPLMSILMKSFLCCIKKGGTDCVDNLDMDWVVFEKGFAIFISGLFSNQILLSLLP